MFMCVHTSTVPIEAREGIRSLGARVAGSCEPPDISIGSQIRVLCKSCKLS